MLIRINEGQAALLRNAADSIYNFLAFAEGQEASYAARQEEWSFPPPSEAPEPDGECTLPFPQTLAGIVKTKKALAGEEVQKEKTASNCKDENAILIPNSKEEQRLLKISDFKKRTRKYNIEARCTFYGKAISLSAKTNTELNKRIREYVREFNELNKPTSYPSKMPAPQLPLPVAEAEEVKPIMFKDYAFEYLKVMKKDDVQALWYNRLVAKLNLHILPFLNDKALTDVSGFDCKEIIKTLRNAKKFRTTEEVYGLLKQVFDLAKDEGIINKNPMARIKFQRAERNHRRCLSMVEEAHLLFLAKGTRYEPYVILMLYAGLRPCECNSAYIDGDFIVSRNMKRRDGKIEWKKIPITPMMREHLSLIKQNWSKLPGYSLQNWFYKMDWDIVAYYCRHTFNTRLGKFKVNQEFRELAMGHKSSDVNIDTYTHYSEIADTYYMELQVVDYREQLIQAQTLPKVLTPKKPKKPRK